MLYTNYVWTKKGEAKAKCAKVNETRKAGFPATFAYQPLEESSKTAKAWLGAGYIEEVETPLPYLQFFWNGDSTTANMHMKKVFMENNIKYRTNQYFALEAEVGENGKMVPVEYYHVEGNLYGIIQRPRTTSAYFEMSPEELYAENSDGYTKEEALLCDHNIHAKPFCSSLYNAIQKVTDYKKLGCEDIEILQRVNNKYAVVCY